MTMQENMAINFDAQVVFEDRGSRWAAYIEPPGMTVYGVTEEAVKARVDLALKLFVHSTGQQKVLGLKSGSVGNIWTPTVSRNGS